jgi:EmrB/QacA subfamily drug resistance transporter
MSVQENTASPGTSAPPRFGRTFAIVAAGVAMSNLDLFIVNVALPQIGAHFHGVSLSTLSWVLNAYAVIFAALLVPAGTVADRLGARGAYLLGIAVFTAASALCSLAPGAWYLIGFRALQAAGAAMLIPASLGIVLATAPPARRMAAVRGWTAIAGLAAALGPVAGGLLTQLDWRWVFLINVPIGAMTLLAGRSVPRTPAGERPGRPDVLGALLFTAAIATLALGLVKSSDWGWGSARVIGVLAAAVILLLAFVFQSARHPAPVLPLQLLRVRGFGPASLANLLFAVPFAAMLLSSVLWCQQLWHWSALRTGLAISPGPIVVPFLAIGAGPLVRRTGAAAVAAAGSVIFGAGIGWWIYAMEASPRYATGMLPGMVLTGIGVGLTLPTLVGAAVQALPPQSFSTGSAVVTMARQLGSVLGVALLVAILNGQSGVRAFDRGWWFVLVATGVTVPAILFFDRVTRGRARG